MILTKIYEQGDNEMIIKVIYDRKEKCVERIVSCEAVIHGIVKADITDIMMNEFDLDKKVGEINWWEVCRETITAEYEAA